MKKILLDAYRLLYDSFGPQGWWPGKSRFEVIVGAILTQNTAWTNVQKAIKNLKKRKVLSPKALAGITPPNLARLIRPSGYYNIKAGRIHNFLDFLNKDFRGDLGALFKLKTRRLRNLLLGLNGIGPETADSILLYAANRPVFVVDAYTKRILSRHMIINSGAEYDEVQRLFMSNLPKNPRLYNEYHALLVKAGKDFCRPRPRCGGCPLRGLRRRNEG